jgi:hypothetical protein
MLLTILILLLNKEPPMLQITTIESTLGLMFKMNITIHQSGILRPLELHKVDIMFLVNKLLPLFLITTTESMLGLILNTKKLTHPSGLLRLQKLLKVDTMLPLKEDKEYILLRRLQFRTTTTESTLGPIHSGKKLIHLNGLPRQLKLHKVDIMSPLKKVQELALLKPQLFQITTTE